MKTLLQKLFVFVLLIGFIQACNEPLVEEQTMDEVELKSAQNGKISYIVVLNDEELNSELANLKGYEMRQKAAEKAAEKVMKRAGLTDGELGFVYGTALKGFSIKIPPGQLKKLENDPSVLRVSEDQIITLIEPSAKPGGDDVQAKAQTTPWGITRVGGGTNYSGSNVAWIIDTGIDLDHPDLNVDATRSAWFVSRVSSANDDNGHGTHVAGTVAAINNGEGVIGVAAGATVIPVKVLDRRGSGSISGVIAGVDYVATNGESGDVANMSLGGSYYKDLNSAVETAAAKGIKFSLAAGNESTDANTKSPASANGTNIYTISAMAQGDVWASYSNYGNPPIDYCAPGSSIYSTYKDGSYATASGTSMAAPHVAGILLLGSVKTDGYVSGDPDGNPDPIGVVGGTATGYAVQVTPESQSETGTPGDVVKYIYTISNTGTANDTYNLSTSSHWTSSVNLSSVPVNAGSSANVTVSHTIPLNAADESSDTGTLNISSTNASTSADFNTTSKIASESVPPVIDSSTLTDNSNPAWTRATVNWTVSDEDSDLASVTTTMKDSDGKVIDSVTSSVSGSSASGTHEVGTRGGGISYTVTLTVKDKNNNEVTQVL